MRSGIAMIMAIAFLVITAGILALMLNMTAVATKKTENKYFYEQAQLLAQSATEYALLAISGHNRLNNTTCVQTIASQFPGDSPAYFNINTTIRYIGLNNPAGPCLASTYIPSLPANPIAPESEGLVLIDVYVNSIENQLNLDQNISYHRRTIQKP
jgi:hypothetical protein